MRKYFYRSDEDFKYIPIKSFLLQEEPNYCSKCGQKLQKEISNPYIDLYNNLYDWRAVNVDKAMNYITTINRCEDIKNIKRINSFLLLLEKYLCHVENYKVENSIITEMWKSANIYETQFIKLQQSLIKDMADGYGNSKRSEFHNENLNKVSLHYEISKYTEFSNIEELIPYFDKTNSILKSLNLGFIPEYKILIALSQLLKNIGLNKKEN